MGTCVCIWLILFVVQQKLTQHCEAIILQQRSIKKINKWKIHLELIQRWHLSVQMDNLKVSLSDSSKSYSHLLGTTVIFLASVALDNTYYHPCQSFSPINSPQSLSSSVVSWLSFQTGFSSSQSHIQFFSCICPKRVFQTIQCCPTLLPG